MKVGLQVGGGELLGADLLREIAEQGIQVARIQAFANDPPHFTLTPPEKTAAMVQEVLDAGLQPYTMIRRAHQLEDIHEGTDVEFANEPDLEGRFGWPSFKGFRDELERTIAVWQGRWRLWTPAVSNLNSRGFGFLERMDWGDIPADIGAAVHRYPDGDDPQPVRPSRDRRFRGADHRDREIAELKRIVNDRPLALSEIGHHTAQGSTDEQVAGRMAWERAFFERHGFDIAIAYQLIDGPQNIVEHRYGFRRLTADGSSPLGPWKPVAAAWTGVTT